MTRRKNSRKCKRKRIRKNPNGTLNQSDLDHNQKCVDMYMNFDNPWLLKKNLQRKTSRKRRSVKRKVSRKRRSVKRKVSRKRRSVKRKGKLKFRIEDASNNVNNINQYLLDYKKVRRRAGATGPRDVLQRWNVETLRPGVKKFLRDIYEKLLFSHTATTTKQRKMYNDLFDLGNQSIFYPGRYKTIIPMPKRLTSSPLRHSKIFNSTSPVVVSPPFIKTTRRITPHLSIDNKHKPIPDELLRLIFSFLSGNEDHRADIEDIIESYLQHDQPLMESETKARSTMEVARLLGMY